MKELGTYGIMAVPARVVNMKRIIIRVPTKEGFLRPLKNETSGDKR